MRAAGGGQHGYPPGGYPAYGPEPWRQTSWDARAAGNFVCGGAGSGLLVVTAIAHGVANAPPALTLAGLALVALGLFSVSLELGRPLRAINVIRNPRTSWMAREAWAAGLLFPAGIAAAYGVPAMNGVAGALALAFLYCQSRLLQAAKGIPAWREPRLVPLIVATGLAEGAGLFFALAPWHGAATPGLASLLGTLLLLRALAWVAYRRRLAAAAPRAAFLALDRAGRVLLIVGTALPLIVVPAIGLGPSGTGALAWAAAAGGLLATLAGSRLKYTLVTRAGFNQGFALPHLPVRGARR